MADSSQRFVVRARSRHFVRFIGFPVGGFLVVMAVSRIPFMFGTEDELALWGIIAGSGVSILLWTWSVSRRRIEVTEQTVTVVSTFRRHEVPWSALSDIELDLFARQR